MLRKFCALLLTLATAMGLVTVLSGTASAANYQVLDWRVSNITAGGNTHHHNYWDLIDRIHRYTYGEPTGVNGTAQTTTERGRLIQVRVLDTGDTHLASVYLWADDLYVAGFYAPQTNSHWVFNDRRQEFANALGLNLGNIHTMPTTGNYSNLPGGNDRSRLELNPERIYNAMRTLGQANQYNDNVGRSLLVAIQTFSEAARFGSVFDVIRGNIENPNRNRPLDYDAGAPRGVIRNSALENQWADISDFVRDSRRNPSNQSIWVMGHQVTTVAALLYWIGFVEVNGHRFSQR
ncbi:ribosome-inactivating family protein [Streptomyces mobaraensis]|uniref:ribosome-inactivating family protein n=1 Tax=Streptomyces mobaraensis TaxID=35621 RepID=UPI00332140E7